MAEERRLTLARAVAAAVATACVAGGCGLFHDSWLEVRVGYYPEPITELEWPRGSGEVIPINNSLTDSTGMAGLEFEVFTPDYHATLTADSIAPPNEYPGDYVHINVPESGEVSIFVRLRQNGVVVAEGHTAWTLDSGVNTWMVLVARAPYASNATPELGSTRCGAPWCHQIRRIEIDENARNYPDEALWLQVERHTGR